MLALYFVSVLLIRSSQTAWTIGDNPLPRADDEHAVGAYDGTIFILGGYQERHTLVELDIATQSVTDHGKRAIMDAEIDGAAQYWSQQGPIIYFIYDDVFNIFDMRTSEFTTNWKGLTFLAPVEDGGCLASSPLFLYVVGGSPDGMDTLQVLSLTTYSWITSPLPSTMQQRREKHACVLHNDYLWAFGGQWTPSKNNDIGLASNERILATGDITQNTWNYIDPLTVGIVNHRAVAYQDTIYVIGGQDLSSTEYAFVHLVDANTGEVSVSSDPMPDTCDYGAPIIVDSTLYVFGGFDTDWYYCPLPTTPQIPTSAVPTKQPTTAPSEIPTSAPIAAPSNQPTSDPSTQPSFSPSNQPTAAPVPTNQPTHAPSEIPTSAPIPAPSEMPTSAPVAAPSNHPVAAPSKHPTSFPSEIPTSAPITAPTIHPTQPTFVPSAHPTVAPIASPSNHPSLASKHPSLVPSNHPSLVPSKHPSLVPSKHPSLVPSKHPSLVPSNHPSLAPSKHPSLVPSKHPTDHDPRIHAPMPNEDATSPPTQDEFVDTSQSNYVTTGASPIRNNSPENDLLNSILAIGIGAGAMLIIGGIITYVCCFRVIKKDAKRDEQGMIEATNQQTNTAVSPVTAVDDTIDAWRTKQMNVTNQMNDEQGQAPGERDDETELNDTDAEESSDSENLYGGGTAGYVEQRRDQQTCTDCGVFKMGSLYDGLFYCDDCASCYTVTPQ